MASPPVSQLPDWVQRTIHATNLPFLATECVFTPVVQISRFTWHLLCRICRQNWIFLCIFYLHLWQTFKSSPPIHPLARHCDRIVTIVLFLGCATPAALILHASIPLFLASWRNNEESHAVRLHHLALFVFTCASASAIIDAVITAVYLWYKWAKYGAYQASMRKLGRGYWADPQDMEDWWKSRSREEAVDRLKGTESKESFVVDRICAGCGAVKEGSSKWCEGCGEYGEKVVKSEEMQAATWP